MFVLIRIPYAYAVVQFYPWYNVISLCFRLIIHYHSPKQREKSLTKDFNKIEPQHMCQAYSGYVHITSVKFSTILKICAFQLCRCSVYMEPPSPYKHLGTKLFKVMCEQTKKMERFHVHKVSGQIFSTSKNCSVPYEYNLNVSLS